MNLFNSYRYISIQRFFLNNIIVLNANALIYGFNLTLRIISTHYKYGNKIIILCCTILLMQLLLKIFIPS